MPSSNEERSLLLLSLYIAFYKVVQKLKGTSLIFISSPEIVTYYTYEMSQSSGYTF